MLIENVVPKREGRLAMPLVLVEDRPEIGRNKATEN